jgi:hypothetical protein
MNKQNKREGFVEQAAIDIEPPVVPPVIEPIVPVPDPEPVKETWPIKVKLMHKPVRNGKGEMVQELSFREPTGGDINRYGNPCTVDQNGDVIILDRKMTTMIAVLSGILQPFIEAMDPRDWNSCAYRLRGFFIPDPAAW